MKWIRLESDMPWDPKIRAVYKSLGPSGVGGLVALWCHIARHGRAPGRAINAKGQPLSVEELIEASLLPAADFRVLVDVCVATGHFERGAWERSREIMIPALARRVDEYTQKVHRRKQQPLVFED